MVSVLLKYYKIFLWLCLQQQKYWLSSQNLMRQSRIQHTLNLILYIFFNKKNTNRHVSKYYFVFPIFSLRDCWNMSSCFVLGKSSRSQPSYVSLPCMYPIYPCSFGYMPTLTNYYDILYLFHKCLVDSIQFVLRLQKYPNKHLENRNWVISIFLLSLVN